MVLQLLGRRRHDILRSRNDLRREFVRVSVLANSANDFPSDSEIPYLSLTQSQGRLFRSRA